MRGPVKKFVERFIKGVLMISSSVTTLTVLLIIFYLFKEASGIFTMSPVESGYTMLANKDNPVRKLDAEDIKNVFDGNIVNWKDIGGTDQDIQIFRIDDISNYYTDAELGENFEHLGDKVDEYVSLHPEVLAFVPDKYILPGSKAIRIKVDHISIKKLFKTKDWFPTATPAAQLGLLPLILGTFWVSLGAIALALPFGLAAAIYMAEIADYRLRNILKPLIELLAGIPSVVYGFFGLVVIVPFIQKTFNLAVGESAIAGSILLGIMALPTIITISEDSIRNTPRPMKEASLALGANHWQTILRVIIPYSISGITAAVILGIGRAIGETMAVLMVTGNAAVIPHSFLEPVRTIPATIAAELGEAPFGGLHFKVLFFLGCILFIITLLINFFVELIAPKRRIER
ncbi:MAG TPA: phosphate ABC transporter permease subunit PstC [Bacteroidia bacterium]|nr:phosphate ABC transporter permease subunit PstC [Bacteroidia bacterium]